MWRGVRAGRRSTIGNRVCAKSVSGVQIPASPPDNSNEPLRLVSLWRPVRRITPSGGVAEWLNAAVSKTVSPVTPVTRVRIPPPPPVFCSGKAIFCRGKCSYFVEARTLRRPRSLPGEPKPHFVTGKKRFLAQMPGLVPLGKSLSSGDQAFCQAREPKSPFATAPREPNPSFVAENLSESCRSRE